MHIKTHVLLLLFYVISFQSFCDTLLIKKAIPCIQDGHLAIDKLENIYIYNQDLLIKLNSNGEIKNKYSNKLLGNITFIDVTNPLKILVFYQGNSTLLLLDNTLTEQSSPISLEQSGIEFVQHACISQNNGFWVYDAKTFQFKRFDEHLNLLSESGNTYLTTKTTLNPTLFYEINNRLIVQDDEKGFFTFDINGNFIKHVACTDCHFLSQHDEIIYYIQHDVLHLYHQTTYDEAKYTLPNKNAQYYWMNGSLWLKTNSYIEKYTIPKIKN